MQLHSLLLENIFLSFLGGIIIPPNFNFLVRSPLPFLKRLFPLLLLLLKPLPEKKSDTFPTAL